MQAFTTLDKLKCFNKYFWEKSHRQASALGLTMVALSRTYTRPPATPVGISSGNLSLRSLTTSWFQSPAQGLRTKTPLSGASLWGGGNTQVPKPTAAASALALSPFCLPFLFRIIVIYDFPELGEDLVDDIFELLKPIRSHLRNVVYNNHRVDPICLLRPIFEYITK